MPLGFERLNERTQRPNALINFIRTLPGTSSPTAEHVLSRVAAVCYPFMKANMILVQALEEFPYNNEFVGRNFNAGEVIQLVLRDRNGRWLPQRMVEMVMVHELAHCKQMNHSKAFWKVRDEYAGDLRVLWGSGYTGEGLWGSGRELDTGVLQMKEGQTMDVPDHLCGGTYGRKTKKRKRAGKEKPILSYAERKQRRILKKFGEGGTALGADDNTKVKLEGGVPKKGKPRVAGSARGRDLRAAAALARFDIAKKEEVTLKMEESPSDSEKDDDFVDGDQDGAAVDVDGKSMFDDKGRALVKICEDENDTDGDARREMDEIQCYAPQPTSISKSVPPSKSLARSKAAPTTKSKGPRGSLLASTAAQTLAKSSATDVHHPSELQQRQPLIKSECTPAMHTHPNQASSSSSTFAKPCLICSLENGPEALTCCACANVLHPDFVPGHWRCKSAACTGSQYINSGDVGICGVCSELR